MGGVTRGVRYLVLLLVVLWAVGQAQPVDAAPAQQTTPQVVLTDLDEIEDWLLGGDFIYWADPCRPGPGVVDEATLQRRAIHSTSNMTLQHIQDEDECATFIRGGADESGYYYYNQFSESIEVIYSHAPFDSPTVLGDAGFLRENGMSSLALDDEYIYWLEYEAQEFLLDSFSLRRLSKEGGSVETLLDYEGGFSNPVLTVNEEGIYWLDDTGLRTVHKSSCVPGSCLPSTLHSSPTDAGHITLDESGDIFWYSDAGPGASDRHNLFRTTCSGGGLCTTDTLYSDLPDFTDIRGLAADGDHVYWTESDDFNLNRLLRMAASGGSVDILLEDDLEPGPLALDVEWLYFKSDDRQSIMRLPRDATAIARALSFRGWEVTQGIQNLDNTVSLVAGKETYVRVYPQLDSGPDSAGVEALLHGARDGTPLAGSPLRPLTGTIAVTTGAIISEQRASTDGGWLFRLPVEWTKLTDDPLPMDDATLTLRAELDPRGVVGDTTPGDNTLEDTFFFTAKVPSCFKLRSIRTETARQHPWDISVASIFDLSESMHPSVSFLPFPDNNPIEKTEWCRKGLAYGPFCTRPYELDNHRGSLIRKLWRKNYLGSPPNVCREIGARTHMAGIVHADAPWGSNGFATYYGKVLVSKVPRYGTWSTPMHYTAHPATTFVHEVGHNFRRRHIPCDTPPSGNDDNYPYAVNTLDDGPLDAFSTHFGFDGRFLVPRDPVTNNDYLSYCHPRWTSDYTWEAIFERTRTPLPPPTFPFGAEMAQEDNQMPAAYMLVSGVITLTNQTGELSPIWTYPSAEAGESLVQLWHEETAEPWPATIEPTPYHVRVLGSDGQVLTDRAVPPDEIFQDVPAAIAHDEEYADEVPVSIVFPVPDAPVQTIQLMQDETVLASYSPSANVPQVSILTPLAGETVDDAILLEWTATDPDDAPWLIYGVQYSPDDGDTWYELVSEDPGIGQGETASRLLNLQGQPGSDGATARLRVLASDGYNTGMATSEAFSVPPRAPQVLISSPDDGQWYRPDAPVALRGAAFDPEDGVLSDHAYVWQLTNTGSGGTGVEDMDIRGPAPMLLGLAPGTYTTTLSVTDSDAQIGRDVSEFHIAPLEIPQAQAEITLNGRCDDVGYGGLSLPLLPYEDGDVPYAAVARTANHLWVCLQGLKSDDALDTGQESYAGFQVDVDNSQSSRVQANDRGYFVRMSGTPVGFVGDGNFFTPTAPDGLATRVVVDGDLWRAELRLDIDAIGGWNQRVALAIGHYFGISDSQRSSWPHRATLHNPQTWAQTNLTTGATPVLASLAPISSTIGSSLTMTVAGSNFAGDTVVLWNGEPLPTTHVDSQTLTVALGSEQTLATGFQDVQIARAGALELASVPHAFLLYFRQPQLTGLSPDSVAMESGGFTLRVDGRGFAPGATVYWDGEPRATTYVDGTHLEVEISAQDVEAGHRVTVSAANPEPHMGTPPRAGFDILPPDEDEDEDENGENGNGENGNGEDENGDEDEDEEDEFRIFVPGMERD